MELLQHIQPIDVILFGVWLVIMYWGYASGIIRQLGMLAAVYVATVATGTTYHAVGQGIGAILPPLGSSTSNTSPSDVIAFAAVFVLAFIIVTAIVWWAYPHTRLQGHQAMNRLVGLLVGAVELGCAKGNPKGCLLVQGALACGSEG